MLKGLEKKQFENRDYVIFAPDNLNDFILNLVKYTEKQLPYILSYFKINQIGEKKQVNIFDDLDKLREFVRNIRNDDSMPTWAHGTFDLGMINMYVDPINIKNKKLTTICHELCHIIYKKYYLNDKCENRIVWLDEGLAQYLSGELSFLENNDEFELFYKKVKIHTKIMPKMCDVTGGQNFKNDNYNGYELGYLCVRYLTDCMSHDSILKILKSLSLSKDIESNIMDIAILYFDNKFNKNRNYVLNRLDILMHQLDKIEYGWLDINNHKHSSLQECKTLYRLSNVEEIISNRLGICFEQVELEKYYLGKEFNVESYALISDKMLHSFIILNYDDKYYYFEHSSFKAKGIYTFDRLEEALSFAKMGFIKRNEIKTDKVKLVKYESLKEHMTYADIIKFLNNISSNV